MATAPAADQHRLLQVQEIDTRVQQAEHRKVASPLIARAQELEAAVAELDQETLVLATAVSDVKREVAKAEDDVQSVRARAARDTERLNSGDGLVSKELVALQSELEVLAARIEALEDAELEAMGRLEQAEQAHAAATARLEQLRAEIAETAAAREKEVAEIDQELAALGSQRVTAVMGLDAGLVALYDKLRAQYGGIGAAELSAGTCQGCHMSLNAGDLSAAQNASADQIVRCEECGRILVRTTA